MNRMSRRLKAEKVILDSLIEFINESQGEGAAPLEDEELKYISSLLNKVNTERKANRVFYR